jgi:thiamine biosynthesis lipoprotein
VADLTGENSVAGVAMRRFRRAGRRVGAQRQRGLTFGHILTWKFRAVAEAVRLSRARFDETSLRLASACPPKAGSATPVRRSARSKREISGLICTFLPRWATLAALFAATFTLGAEENLSRIQGRTMGTTYSVAIAGPLPAPLATLQPAVQHRLDALEAAMSTYRDTSAVSRFNSHEGTEWFPVDPDTAAVVALAQRISAETLGAFDITVHPVVCLWGFGPDPAPAAPPTAAAIARALAHVNHRNLAVRLSPPALRKHDPALAIDLSGIAKGYAAGAVADVLERHGVTAYLIVVGGEVRARGGRPGHRTWRIGLERPAPDGTQVHRVLELTDTAVSTSGDYRNFQTHSGVRHSHLLDPRTGRPIAGALSAVNVIDADSARADALATALMVMGETAALAWADSHGLACVLFSRHAAGIRATPSRAFAARFPQAGAGPDGFPP